MPASMLVRDLFGGAISMTLPSDYLDASDLRQVPDNQEVYLSPNSESSLIVEILGMVEEGAAKTDLWEAAKYHFNSLAHDNAALQSTILTPQPPSPIPSTPTTTPSTPTPVFLAGTQVIHKFSYDPMGVPRPGREADRPDTVWIGLALWRCWLEPPTAGPGEGRKKADVVLSVNVNISTDGQESDRREGGGKERDEVERWFKDCVESFRIVDWGLFGDAE